MSSSRNKYSPLNNFPSRTIATVSVTAIRMSLGSRLFLFLMMLATMGVAGCGGTGSDGMAPVQGVVTLDGKPLTSGFVFVTPAEGRSAKGTIQVDGSFVLGTNAIADGVKTGTHPVSVKPPPAREGMPLSDTAKALPTLYTSARTSGLTVEVKPNTDNQLTLELVTQ